MNDITYDKTSYMGGYVYAFKGMFSSDSNQVQICSGFFQITIKHMFCT